MLKGEKQADLSSVVDPSNDQLVSDPDSVKNILHSHYQRVFTASTRPAVKPAWVDHVYTPKPGINTAWYNGLMGTISPEELRTALKDGKAITAPGRDGISVADACHLPSHRCALLIVVLMFARNVCPYCGKELSHCPHLEETK
jgi:hypothetical protein